MNLRYASLALAFAAASAAAAQTPLQTVLAQMDKSSATFKSATASVHQQYYEKVLHDTTTRQNGTVYFERSGSATTMGATFTDEGSTAKPQIVTFDGTVLRNYTPGTNLVDVIKVSASAAQSYYTLGFGGSGKDLAAAWNIADAGPETVDGARTEKLELTPKDPKIAQTFSKVVLWFDPVLGVSRKQVFYTPQGDYRTTLYTNIHLNTRIDKAPYNIPKNAKVINH